MKKLLLFGLILAILILAMPQGVLAFGTSATVNANIEGVMTCDANSNVNPWALVRNNVNSVNDGISYNVTSTTDWTMTAADITNPLTGHMRDSTVSKNLINPFGIEKETGGQASLETAVQVKSGTPITKTKFDANINQTVDYADYSGNAYQIQIQFTCAAPTPP
jgi:hypothetical protein